MKGVSMSLIYALTNAGVPIITELKEHLALNVYEVLDMIIRKDLTEEVVAKTIAEYIKKVSTRALRLGQSK
jgi:hypothetical protein